MISYTKRNVFVITLAITVLIYIVISVISSNVFNQDDIITNDETKVTSEENKLETQEKEEIWQIRIPKIDLIANIKEGTTPNIIAKYVGHFKNTSKLDGNIGLAAHNRGIGVESYFKNIKYLDIGDEIIYQKDEDIKKYEVTKNIIIDETDWTYLADTNDNKITLITCVENKPEYRQCIQATEKGI